MHAWAYCMLELIWRARCRWLTLLLATQVREEKDKSNWGCSSSLHQNALARLDETLFLLFRTRKTEQRTRRLFCMWQRKERVNFDVYLFFFRVIHARVGFTCRSRSEKKKGQATNSNRKKEIRKRAG